MKKAVLVILIALAITFSFSLMGTGTVARAAELDYGGPGDYRADGNLQVYRNIDGVETPLFYIQDTYYFKIYKAGTGKYLVTYGDIPVSEGLYIKSDSNFKGLDEAVDKAPLGAFTLALALSADCNFYKFDFTEFISVPVLAADANTSIEFIGYGTHNAAGTDLHCAYVALTPEGGAKMYGFIEVANLKVKDGGAALSTFEIPKHINRQPVAEDNTGDETGDTKNDKLIRTILIVGIVVPALIIMFLLFKPSKRGRYDYDRNRPADSGVSPYDRPRSRYRDDYYDDGRRQPPPPPRGRGYDDEDDYYDRRY